MNLWREPDFQVRNNIKFITYIIMYYKLLQPGVYFFTYKMFVHVVDALHVGIRTQSSFQQTYDKLATLLILLG